MKRYFLTICVFALSSVAFAAGVVIDNIKYELIKGQQAVSCSADKAKDLTVVEIPTRVSIKGRFYPVTQIEDGGFRKCKNLKSIVIPTTVNYIGSEAFWDCPNLESVVMPDICKVEVSDGSYGFGKYGIFRGCKSLKRVRGTNMLYPQYMILDALYNCKDVPAFAQLNEVDPSEFDKVGNLSEKFSSYAKSNYLSSVEQWQRRKSYETKAQWEARVNDANRKKMVDEAVAEARTEFLRLYSPVAVKGTLEDYDQDNQIFPIYMGDMGTIYASVPQDEAETFAKNWNSAKVIPQYGIIDDGVGIVTCSYVVGDKTYTSPRAYSEDDFDELMLLLTPLASLQEYERQLEARESKAEEKKTYAPDEIDIQIPATLEQRNKTFAVVIGNENYQRVAKVDYAQNDARVLSKYLTRALGIPETNVRTYYDATYGDIIAAVEDIKSIADAYKGDIDVIFYYAGHGIPDESSRSAFILPVDAQGTNTESCYPLSRLYNELADLNAQHTLVLMDACFSGSLRGDGMLASARGIKMKPKEVTTNGNMVILSAASGDQTAYPYPEKNHGLFSYFLIKKLHDTEGNVTLGELSEYIIDNVSQRAITTIKKPQSPTVKYSDALSDSWKDIKF